MLFALLECLRGWAMPFPFWIRDTGRRGEYLVRRRYHRRGYHLIAKNWRYGRGEIDLIMANWRQVRFLEVKTRKLTVADRPHEQISADQRRRLHALARGYMRQWADREIPWRFQLVLLRYAPGWRRLETTESPL